MNKIASLTPILLPLQLFGLQYFDISSLSKPQTSSFSRIKFKIFFLAVFPLYTLISSYYYILGFMAFEDVSSAHNFLQYEFKIITYGGRFLIIGIAMIESFTSTSIIQQILINACKFSAIIEREFSNFRHSKYEELKSVMKRRLMISAFFLTSLELLPFVFYENPLEKLPLSLAKLFGAIIISMVIYKFCLYVDFINFHINILACLIQKHFHVNSNFTESEKGRKFNQIRLCFINILDMAKCLNESVTYTMPMIVGIVIMCLIRRAYRFYALFSGQLHLKAFFTTLLNNTSEELAYIIGLCYCCNRTEVVVSKKLVKN